MVKKIHLSKSICIILGLALMIALLPVLPVSADTAAPVSVNAGSTVNAEYLQGYRVENSTFSAKTTFVLKAEKTGALVAAFANVGGGTVTLSSSSGKQLSRPLSVSTVDGTAAWQQKVYFGVTAGKTYRITVSSVSRTAGLSYYGVAFENDAVKNSSGTSKAKAKTISRNKAYSAVLPAGSRSSAWMKVKVKKGTVKVMMQGYVDNSMYGRCSVAGATLKNNQSIPINLTANGNNKSRGVKLKMYKAATLYIQIARPQANTSGVVMVKVTQ
ncbi:MAG: hypothetical protein ACI4W2_00470 [Eubacterium sp.]